MGDKQLGGLLDRYDSGQISRRELLGGLAAIAMTPAMAAPQPATFFDPDLTEEKLAEFERFFSPIASTVLGFAERHNLGAVEKYRWAHAQWVFDFRLAEEGSRGHLQVGRTVDEQVSIMGTTDHLDLKAYRRLVSVGAIGRVTVPRDAAQVADALEDVLIRIVTLPISEMRPDGWDHSSWRVEREANQVRAGLASLTLVKMD
jgi:hypothetical protein